MQKILLVEATIVDIVYGNLVVNRRQLRHCMAIPLAIEVMMILNVRKPYSYVAAKHNWLNTPAHFGLNRPLRNVQMKVQGCFSELSRQHLSSYSLVVSPFERSQLQPE